ncbi:3-hydroxyisobutyrate dehydrogenase [Aurantimonas sp. Leaf443]|uniref:3-hydroxyisobutyrate dehydrogenase n=1 Tax=Aurantimonas sp. Leaf443 TaxID=1736378 RepID=UPI0006F60078|nr:3-hydroxyisobutyrate dehydrogenase [Aurantimonas sp. Leaf443]KQT88021.1 3-hydroxyisobutyrate dehydrogenase [Aurantimonas sp. Leaf443]
MRIAFIGLGNMGAPMARNLIAAGHDVRGFDAAAATIEGVPTRAGPEEAVAGAEAVVTMLPNGAIVRDVHARVLAAAAPGTLLIDCSTIDVESARHVQEAARAAGLRPLDAPVSGGTGGAAAGTLTFMVGGEAADFEAGRPILEAMGKRIVHCGAAGAGQAAKICNNMILGISMVAVCEGFHLADRLGLDRQALFDVASTSSGACWSLNTYCPAPGVGPQSPADNGYKPGFAAELMLKDLTLSQEASASAGASTELGAHARDVYARFVEAGGRGRDFSALLETLSKA